MIEPGAHPGGSTLAVRAQPGANRNAVLGERTGSLRVAVSAAPERGKANAAIAEVLAEAQDCKGSQVILLAGETARDKRFLVVGLTPDHLSGRIRVALPSQG